MKKYLSAVLILCMSFMVGVVPINTYAAPVKDVKDSMTCNQGANELNKIQRKLWSDHISWTRDFVISDLASLEDKDVALERLLKNQDDIGNSFKAYYGEENAKKLSALLREHITIAGGVVSAAKSGNKAEFEKVNKLWYENADKIADVLSVLNPNWSKNAVKDMLYQHLKLLTDQVVARLNKDWKADVAAYDAGLNHMIMFSDIVSNGIVKQFPDKFK